MNKQKIFPTDSQFTEEFITTHADVIYWNYITENIIKCTHFSDDFFFRFKRNIIWKQIYPYQKLTTEFVHKYQDKLRFIAWYNENNELHRDNDEPAIIFADGEKRWYKNGQLHRDNDLPAVIFANGDKYWYQNDNVHRDNDQPAIIYANGDEYWYQNGKIHRDNDQPAIIWVSGNKQWRVNGKIHRDNDQPAVIDTDG